MVEKVIIIGSGPAGLSAAIYTSRDGLSPLMISGYHAGGLLILTSLIENVPGFPKGIQGPDYIQLLMEQAKKFGTKFINKDATKVDFSSRPFKISVGDDVYEAESVIVATGTNPRWLGLESEKRFIGRGVSNCATCDAPFFKGKNVVVVGGGDTAMEDSLFLTTFADSVTIVHRRDAFKASKIMQDRVFSNPKIKVIWNSGIEEIKGGKTVTSVLIKNLATNNVEEMKTDGIFVAVGYEPNTELFQGQLKLDDQGYIVAAQDSVKTDIKGVFAAGDVVDKIYKQAATAEGSGVRAALEARAYLSNLTERKPTKAF